MSSDWAQNRAIRDLSEAMSAQAAAASARQRAVERRLQALQGDLSTQVNTLTFQLNALIELGDIRDELTLYIPTRRAREAAVDLTRAVLRGDGDLTYLRQSPDLASDGDYWLVPAAIAIVDVRQGVLDSDAADTALRLDRGRAAPFLVAVTALVGRPELASALLPDCFLGLTATGGDASSVFGTAEPDAAAGSMGNPGSSSGADAAASTKAGGRRGSAGGASVAASRRYGSASDPTTPSSPPVTNAERTLWRATAAGLLGNEAVGAVRDAVDARLAPTDPSAWTTSTTDPLAEAPRLGHLASEPDPLARIDGAPGSTGGGRDGSGTGGGTSREAVLGAWSLWAERIGAHELRGSRAVGPADLAASPPGSVVADLERAAFSLALEGGPRERELLERADLLGSHLGKVADREPQWWSAIAAGVVQLVVADARSADVDTAALVAPLLAPSLLRAADAHRDRLLGTPDPTASVKLGVTATVTVTPSDDGTAAADRARSAYLAEPIPGPRWWLTGGLAAGGLLVAGIALAQGVAGWWILAILLLAVAAGTYLASLRGVRDERERRDEAVARYDAALIDARTKVRTEAAALAASRESARLGHAAVTRSLVGVTSPAA
ncbi:hypothetical protein [Serinibacter arcticus]|uniref:hypothetical protein n=1 Tax=Serinibacter arcticus TaxID=1655435 RepID=UPI0010928322|nr:hypothetical protein [Serinibacter arcticus]